MADGLTSWSAVHQDAVRLLRSGYATASAMERDRVEGGRVASDLEDAIEHLSSDARYTLGEVLSIVATRMVTGGPLVRWWWGRTLDRLGSGGR